MYTMLYVNYNSIQLEEKRVKAMRLLHTKNKQIKKGKRPLQHTQN